VIFKYALYGLKSEYLLNLLYINRI